MGLLQDECQTFNPEDFELESRKISSCISGKEIIRVEQKQEQESKSDMQKCPLCSTELKKCLINTDVAVTMCPELSVCDLLTDGLNFILTSNSSVLILSTKTSRQISLISVNPL